MRSLSVRVLIALVAGMALGILFASLGGQWLRIVGWIEPIGTLWINAIRMVVIPLVVSAIMVGIAATPELRTVGRLGISAIILFFIILFAAAFFTVLTAPLAVAFLDIDPAAALALRESVAASSGAIAENANKIQSLRQWLVELVPVNPVKAAADGAMLPLIFFAAAFGIAISRIDSARRSAFLDVMQAVLDASLLLVGWFLVVAPVGVFALSLAVAAKLGTAAAGAVLFYVVLSCALLTLFILLLTVGASIFGRWTPREFMRLAGPGQAVAFSSRSSLVSLPALVASAERAGMPLPIRTFLLPLAVATFRPGAAIVLPTGAIFLAKLYGVDLGPAELITIAVTAVFTTFSVPGVPGGSIIVMVPVLMSVNLPIEGIGLLLAVDTLPDMFRTATNVTGDMSVAAVLSRGEKSLDAHA